jgi:hypothetical protein
MKPAGHAVTSVTRRCDSGHFLFVRFEPNFPAKCRDFKARPQGYDQGVQNHDAGKKGYDVANPMPRLPCLSRAPHLALLRRRKLHRFPWVIDTTFKFI